MSMSHKRRILESCNIKTIRGPKKMYTGRWMLKLRKPSKMAPQAIYQNVLIFRKVINGNRLNFNMHFYHNFLLFKPQWYKIVQFVEKKVHRQFNSVVQQNRTIHYNGYLPRTVKFHWLRQLVGEGAKRRWPTITLRLQRKWDTIYISATQTYST